MRAFKQVDVFTNVPYLGNPVAVVFADAGTPPSFEQMQTFARWTNLSETTFLLAPSEGSEADYRVRIFTPSGELPFAGHPTLGTCHAWLEAGGTPKVPAMVVQECGAGMVRIRRDGERLAFAAPPLIRGGDVSEGDLAGACAVLGIERGEIIAAQWADNGPGWMGVRLESAERVLALRPNFDAVESYDLGVVGPHPIGLVAPHESAVAGAPAIEVRAFFRADGVATEDPVTGSLNAALAMWLLGDGTLQAPYVAAQGTAMGRAGRVYIDQDVDVWVGGDTVTCIDGKVRI